MGYTVEAASNEMNSDPVPAQPHRILAAIEALDVGSLELNVQILARAAQLARRGNGELHVAFVCASLLDETRVHHVDRYVPALRVKARNRRRCAIRQLLRGLNIDTATIHVEEGPPHQAISDLASKLHASFIVDAAAVRASAPAVQYSEPIAA